MANKTLFRSTPGKSIPATDAVNEAGGTAYALPPEAALAQFAATGCLNGAYYSSGEEQLKQTLELCKKVNPRFVAQVALWARERGHMKDMPALLAAFLTKDNGALAEVIFSRVIDSPKMLRNFVQIMRSGAVGRKSLGSRPRRLVRLWLDTRTSNVVFKGSVGNDPSMADLIKMVHPKPDTDEREALYGYLLDREHVAANLPALVREFEAWKASKEGSPPDVPFEMLTALQLTEANWSTIARNATWTQTRMNLNTFSRHGVFKDPEMVKLVAERLVDRAQIVRAKAFPYQLLAAFLNVNENVPKTITNALQDAMEIATENVPVIAGQVFVFPDVSGSMSSPVTGHRAGSTSKMRCIDIAALVAACIIRKNPDAEVIPFETSTVRIQLNPRDSVMTNAQKLGSIGGGGTNCSAPLAALNRKAATADALVYVSDSESWVDSAPARYGWMDGGDGTATMKEFRKLQQRSPKVKMVCINIQAYGSVQASEAPNEILNVGGFSDAIFDVIAKFAAGDGSTWVDEIKAIPLA